MKTLYLSKPEFVKRIIYLTYGKHEFDNEPLYINELCDIINLSSSTVRYRLRDAAIRKSLNASGIDIKRIGNKTTFLYNGNQKEVS